MDLNNGNIIHGINIEVSNQCVKNKCVTMFHTCTEFCKDNLCMGKYQRFFGSKSQPEPIGRV